MKAPESQINEMSKASRFRKGWLPLLGSKNLLPGSTMLEYSVVGVSIFVVCLVISTGLGSSFFKTFAPFLAFMNYQQANTNFGDPSTGSPDQSDIPDVPSNSNTPPLQVTVGGTPADQPSHTAGANGSQVFSELADRLTGMANQYHGEESDLAANVLYKLANEGDIMGQYLRGTITLQQAQEQAKITPGLEKFSEFLKALANVSKMTLNQQIQTFTEFYQDDVLNDPGFNQLTPGDQQTVNVLVNGSAFVAAFVPALNQIRMQVGQPPIGEQEVEQIFHNMVGIRGQAK